MMKSNPPPANPGSTPGFVVSGSKKVLLVYLQNAVIIAKKDDNGVMFQSKTTLGQDISLGRITNMHNINVFKILDTDLQPIEPGKFCH